MHACTVCASTHTGYADGVSVKQPDYVQVSNHHYMATEIGLGITTRICLLDWAEQVLVTSFFFASGILLWVSDLV